MGNPLEIRKQLAQVIYTTKYKSTMHSKLAHGA